MHVLFIGGTGLISTAIARQLLQSGHEVTLFNRGQSPSRLPEGAQVIQGDRNEYAKFEDTFRDKTFDVAVDMVSFHPDAYGIGNSRLQRPRRAIYSLFYGMRLFRASAANSHN
jgi:nucleoside-diphosphate-sugar epimerase